jgi:hypothetical protein
MSTASLFSAMVIRIPIGGSTVFLINSAEEIRYPHAEE